MGLASCGFRIEELIRTESGRYACGIVGARLQRDKYREPMGRNHGNLSDLWLKGGCHLFGQARCIHVCRPRASEN